MFRWGYLGHNRFLEGIKRRRNSGLFSEPSQINENKEKENRKKPDRYSNSSILLQNEESI